MGGLVAKLTCMGIFGKGGKCCCCPLSLCAILLSAYWAVAGSIAIWNGVKQDPDEISSIINGSLQCFVGLCGLLAAFLAMAMGAWVAFMAYLVSWLVTLISFIIQWVEWGKGLNKDPPTYEADAQMISWTIVQSLAIIFGYMACAVFYALYERLNAGKSGWRGDDN